MKNIGFLLILGLGVLLTACKKEDRNCVKTEFIGDFVGHTVCIALNGSTGPEVATVIRISERTGANEITLDVDGLQFDMVIDGCNISGINKDTNVDLIITGSLNGEKLKIKLDGIAFGAPLNCESEGEKN